MTKNNNDMSGEDVAMNDIDNDDSVVDARIFNQALRRRDLNFPHPLSVMANVSKVGFVGLELATSLLHSGYSLQPLEAGDDMYIMRCMIIKI
ncbi:hypothetical protein KY284_036752 [Solanum tuberosum]|nr:hypothetical protein KY284_036752 [Solanum tuberosum]